jgi:hypothetical protein
MSRSGYTDEFEDIGAANLYRANVARAIAGKRGQAFLREMATALDAMPVKELVADEVVRDSAHVCAMGAVALARKLDVSDLDVYNADEVARILGIAESLAREISYENDECSPMHEKGPDGGWVRRPPETPAERWQRMRKWVGEKQRRTESHPAKST